MGSVSFLLFLFSFGMAPATTNIPQAPEENYVQQAAQNAIFIYDANTKPCDPPIPGQTPLPLGSGFVVGVARKGATDTKWTGWKFLVTAEHVIKNHDSVILRLNRKDVQGFTCYSLRLVTEGQNRNVFTSDQPEIDLIAIGIPDIPNTDPTVFDYSLILDEQLNPLTQQELTDLIVHRIKVASINQDNPPNFFTEGSIVEIYKFSKGFPRRALILCDELIKEMIRRDMSKITEAALRVRSFPVGRLNFYGFRCAQDIP